MWKKYKTRIILSIVAISVLAATYTFGGNYSKNAPVATTSPTMTAASTPTPIVTQTPAVTLSPTPSAEVTIIPEVSAASPTPDAKFSAVSDKGSEDYSKSQGMIINPETGKDQYKTDPVPSGKPVPVEPQNATVTQKQMSCTLSVRCDTILNNMNLLKKDKWELVPKDGVIFAAKTVTFYEGESVFNVLQREMKRAKIHFEFKNTPMYNSAYIEGINNLYEFDVGELSGWMYKVNGWFPNYGCSRYQLKDGDTVEWIYTCDLGRDIGGYSAVGMGG